ncbi:MAG: hypothetical protein ACI4F1_13310 [Bariatricus sp.]
MDDTRILLSKEEYQSLMEAKIKLDGLARCFQKEDCVLRDDFEIITGFEFAPKEDASFSM